MAADLKKMKLTNRRILQNSTNSEKLHTFCLVYRREDDNLSLLSINGRMLHILHDDRTVMTIQCPGRIQDACICVDESLYLFVLSTSHALYKTPLPVKLLRTNSSEENSNESDAIFDELLGENEANDPAGSSMVLKNEDKLVELPGVTRLTAIGNYLVALIPGSDVTRIHVYRWKPDKNALENITTYCIDVCEPETDAISLSIVCPSDYAVPVQSNEHVLLERPLFVHLFGGKYGLLETPILLIGFSTGQVHFAPLHPPLTDSSPPQVKLLCDLQQSTVAFFTVHIPMENNDSKSKLCVLGQSGKVLLLTDGNPGESMSEEYYVTGPVVSAIRFGTEIIHSTGSEYLVTDMKQIKQKEVYSHLKSEVFSAGLTTCMAPLTGAPNQTKDWLSITKAGHVYEHSISLVSESVPSDDPSKSSGKSLKDLLTGISQSSEQLQRSQQKVASLDVVLRQLALASYTATNYNNQSASTCPLKLTVSIDHHDFGQETKVNLHVRFSNESAIELTEGWTLTVVMSTTSNVERSWCWSGNLSKTVPIHCGLSKGQHQDLIIPLTQSHCSSLPLTIEGFVSYCPINEHLPPNPVTIPLSVLTIDTLHFLCAENSSKPCNVSQMLSERQNVLENAKARSCWQLHKKQVAVTRSDTGHHSMTVLCRETQEPPSSEKHKKLSPELRLFHYLIKDSNLDVGENQASVTAVCVANNRLVSLLVRKRKEDGLEVIWGSDDIHTVSLFHSAVVGRIQKHPSYSEIAQGKSSLNKFKELGECALTLQDRTSELDCDWNHLAGETIDLYRKLRSLKT